MDSRKAKFVFKTTNDRVKPQGGYYTWNGVFIFFHFTGPHDGTGDLIHPVNTKASDTECRL